VKVIKLSEKPSMSIKIIKATRARNNNGRFHQTHSNKLISTLEKERGIKTGFRPNHTIGDLLNHYGFESVTQYLEHKKWLR
jgi:hypothetical protein